MMSPLSKWPKANIISKDCAPEIVALTQYSLGSTLHGK